MFYSNDSLGHSGRGADISSRHHRQSKSVVYSEKVLTSFNMAIGVTSGGVGMASERKPTEQSKTRNASDQNDICFFAHQRLLLLSAQWACFFSRVWVTAEGGG